MDSDITAKVKISASFSDARDIANEVKKLIDTDLQKYSNLTNICDIFEMHEKQIRRIFRQRFNKTPTQYIKIVRLHKLDEFIQNYGQNVYKFTHEISKDLGYSSQESLYKLISSVTGGKTWKQYYTSKLT